MLSDGIHFREFKQADAEAFRRLNEDWITKYFDLEEKDRAILADPEPQIIRRGGQIFLGVKCSLPIGCCALIIWRVKNGRLAECWVERSPWELYNFLRAKP